MYMYKAGIFTTMENGRREVEADVSGEIIAESISISTDKRV